MSQHTSSQTHHYHRTTSLFVRIMFWVSIPLIGLSVFFSSIQLTQQLRASNKLNELQSKFTFATVRKALQGQFQKDDFFSDLPFFLRELNKSHPEIDINCFDILKKKLVVDSNYKWTHDDVDTVESVLANRTMSSSPYTLRVDKEAKLLIAYMLFNGEGDQKFYVARTIFPLADIRSAFNSSRGILLLIITMVIVIGFIIGQGLSRSIIRPIRELNRATREIIHGQLGSHVNITTGDEIEALAHTFNKMSDSLEEMNRQAQDANPLTGLPGNAAIHNNLRKRISERQKFIMFHCDIDRFKVFNDQFGLAQGDKGIQHTAEFLKKVIKEKGVADDFLGHQGGDDFVLILKPQHAVEIAQYVEAHYKEGVCSQLYSKEDFQNGFTMQLDRRRQTETGEKVMIPFPLISLSMAGVSNAKKEFADYSDCMSRVAPVKKEVKQQKDCHYLIKE